MYTFIVIVSLVAFGFAAGFLVAGNNTARAKRQNEKLKEDIKKIWALVDAKLDKK